MVTSKQAVLRKQAMEYVQKIEKILTEHYDKTFYEANDLIRTIGLIDFFMENPDKTLDSPENWAVITLIRNKDISGLQKHVNSVKKTL